MGNELVRLVSEFDGHRLVVITYKGRECWLAPNVEDVLEYSRGKLGDQIRVEWKRLFIEGTDFDVIRGADLAALRAALDGAAFSVVPPKTSQITVLYESGLNKVFIKTNKPRAVPLQRFVAETVLPALRRDGTFTMPAAESVLPPAPSAEIVPTADGLDVIAAMVAHLREQRDRTRVLEAETRVQAARAQALEHAQADLATRLEDLEAVATIDGDEGLVSAADLATRANWRVDNAERLPHNGAVIVAAANAGLADDGRMRQVWVREQAHEKIVPRWMFTRRGVDDFFAQIHPQYAPDVSHTVAANERARAKGVKGRWHFIRATGSNVVALRGR